VSRDTGVTVSDTGGFLLSRIFVTWAELVVVGFLGAALGTTVSGPPQLVVYLATILGSVSVLLYNVDRLVVARVSVEN
jgi:energy-converting hydrogenase Eha subunit E